MPPTSFHRGVDRSLIRELLPSEPPSHPVGPFDSESEDVLYPRSSFSYTSNARHSSSLGKKNQLDLISYGDVGSVPSAVAMAGNPPNQNTPAPDAPQPPPTRPPPSQPPRVPDQRPPQGSRDQPDSRRNLRPASRPSNFRAFAENSHRFN
ncbi:hypothetical protein TWF225_009974 [Orbilia oligospora]|nr:hypothetical protein TWF751_005809 [Orbilia oligospora]KAF3172682.1 hypothetical protein TWF225_009974 [Orbilia oligospora]KAF3243931.1 hypothetical protein TWF128_009868 [Orbilia oligospora]KAF3245869.1 hypothetical protein TWF217_010051 [Orbilia oligospora]